MGGERILLVDSSAGLLDMSKSALEENGFKVTTASNGMAALAHPDLDHFNLVIMETGLEGVEGLDAAAQIRTDAETFGIPVLMLIPEEELETRASQSLRGANGFLAKPFSPVHLSVKVKEILEEQRLKSLSENYLRESADKHMQMLAEQKIQQAVEKKIQIIVERAIQSIVSIIDQRAKREVDARVTALTAEKEQELVRLTVQEVARSMVEKIAEKKVTEAIDAVLMETTEKTVKRAADSMLPSIVRERLRESIENSLPREIQTRVDKAASEKMGEFGEALVNVLQQEAKKTVPLVAKERLPEIAERQVALACDQRVPQLVVSEARGAVAAELAQRVKPLMESEYQRIKSHALFWIAMLAAAMFLFTMVISWFITGGWK
jgi:DNA-binding response OmpR family regulator